MSDEEEDKDKTVIGPKIPQRTTENTAETRLTAKLNHFFSLKTTKGLSLNQQLAAHPDFHAPGITETLLDFLGLDPWGSNHPNPSLSRPSWEPENGEDFDYLKVSQDQRAIWENKNQQIMNATTTTNSKNSHVKPPPVLASNFKSNQMPRKRI